MATRRDQLHSYQFLTQRVLSALVMRETDPAQSPLRRGVGAVFVGVMIAVLVAAGYGVYGIFTKVGNDNWRSDGAVVVEKESGASFVYLDGKLHPALNYASALLAARHTPPTVFRVPGKSLTGVPRDLAIGIPQAPSSLPAGDKTVGFPWTVCSSPGGEGGQTPQTIVTMLIGQTVEGGHELTDDEGLLVTDGTSRYLVWKGYRYLLRQSDKVIGALFGAPTAARVGKAWLNALPAGVDIGPIDVPKGGTSTVSGYKVGDLLVSTGSVAAYYLVYPDGLAVLTPVQRALVLGAGEPQPIDVARAADSPKSNRLSTSGDPGQAPGNVPKLVTNAAQAPCARTDSGRFAPTVSTGGSVEVSNAIRTPARSPTGTPLVNLVLMPPGRAAVVRMMASPGAQTGALAVVTDTGTRYPVADENSLQYLGFQPGQAIELPDRLAAQLPAGPTLDAGTARQAAPVSRSGG